MAGKRKDYDEKKQKYSVFLEPDTLKQLQEMSEYLQTSLSELLERVFSEYLQRQHQEVNNEKETEAETEKGSIHEPHGP